MRFKRFIAAAAALLISGTAAFSAIAGELGTAGVYSADVYWDVQFWGGAADDKGNMNIASVTNAKITGDGIYTASVKFAYPLSYGQYFALGTSFKGDGKGEDSFFADYPDAKIKILKVKADGVEIKGSDVPDVNVEGFMRVYIYNPWTDDNLNYADDLDWTAGITEIEVTFEITGLEKAAVTTVPLDEPRVTTAETEETAVTTVSENETEPSVTTEPDVTTVISPEPAVTAVTEKEAEPSVTAATTIEAAVTETEPAVTAGEAEVTTAVTTVSEKEPEQTATTSVTTEAPAETEPDTAVSEPAVTEPESAETVTEITAETGSSENESVPPAGDDETSSVNTGNISVGWLSAAAAMSGVTAFLTRKKHR